MRNRADSWHAVLRDECQPPRYPQLTFQLVLPVGQGSVKIASFWPDDEPDVAAYVKEGLLQG